MSTETQIIECAKSHGIKMDYIRLMQAPDGAWSTAPNLEAIEPQETAIKRYNRQVQRLVYWLEYDGVWDDHYKNFDYENRAYRFIEK